MTLPPAASPTLQHLRFYLSLALLWAFLPLFSQKATVNGVVKDENQGTAPSVSVRLFAANDTMPLKYALTDTAGIFKFVGLKAGKYSLRFAYLGYLEQQRDFSLQKGQDLDLGVTELKPDPLLLKEVQVTAKATPIIIRNDTIFYRAASFATREHASVLELLKKLPGLEVGRDGTIRSNGKVVENILVDGKPFFSDDQSTTTRVLPADAIETVEVYDQGSRKADFTGIDDGESEKTINLVLKEDRKKGWFGELSGSGGGSAASDSRYEGSMNANRFSPKHQFSITGNASNLNPYGGAGFSRSAAGGVNYNKSFGDKRSLFGDGIYSNYQYGLNDTKAAQEVARQVFLDQGSLYTREKNNNENLGQSHNLTLNTSASKDTTSVFSMGANLNFNTSRQVSADSSWSFDNDKQPLNKGVRTNNSEDGNENVSFDMMYGRRLNAKGTAMTMSGSLSHSGTRSKGRSQSENTFYERGSTAMRTEILDQEMSQHSKSINLNLSADLTQPITKDVSLQANWGFNIMRQNNKVLVNDLSGGEVLRNDSLSSDFDNLIGGHFLGMSTGWEVKQWNLSTHISAQNTFLSGDPSPASKNTPVKRSYWSVMPSLSASRSIGENQNFNIDYSASTMQPDVSQLQPIPDNSDPLNIREGNPDLRPEFGHSTNFSYNFNHPKSSSGFFVNTSLSFTQNKIIETVRVDQNFVRRYRPQNGKGMGAVSGGLNYYGGIKKWKTRHSISFSGDFSQGQVLISERLNTTTNTAFRQNINLSFNPKEWLNMDLNAGFSQNNVRYDIETKSNQGYRNNDYSASVNVNLPRQFSFNTNFNISQSFGRSEGFNQTIPIWNVSIGRNFLKSETLVVRLEASDLLNRRVGISRSVELNYLEDRKAAVLSRYFLLRVSYLIRAI
jgi:hypothetical protein